MKNKNKTILCTYTLPIFPTLKLIVIITNNIPGLKYKFHCNEGYIDWADPTNNTPGMTWYGYTKEGDDRQCVIITLDPQQCAGIIDSTASHEALHAAYHILDVIGIELNDYTNEVYAYTVGWATQCVKDAYQKWLKKR